MQIKDKVLELAKKLLPAVDVVRTEDWNGYEVWDPIPEECEGPVCIGAPFVFLVKDGNIRMCTTEEAFEHHSWECRHKEEQEKQAQAMAEKCRKEADAVKFDPKKV